MAAPYPNRFVRGWYYDMQKHSPEWEGVWYEDPLFVEEWWQLDRSDPIDEPIEGMPVMDQASTDEDTGIGSLTIMIR
jgi:hypothetical protein